MIGYRSCFRQNDDLPLGRGPAVKKKPPFSNARALITRKITRSKDAQCNTGEFKDQRPADSVRSWKRYPSRVQNPKYRIQHQAKRKQTPYCEPTMRSIPFKCDLCDADYFGYTYQHLYQRIEERYFYNAEYFTHSFVKLFVPLLSSLLYSV